MRDGIGAFLRAYGSWLLPLIAGAALTLVMAMPALLVPIAQAYVALCARYPFLALVTKHTSALPVALLLTLSTLALIVGVRAGFTALLATIRFNRHLQQCAAPLPPRLMCLGGLLRIVPHVTFLPVPQPMACCYGLLRPRIAITVGLLDCLDDAELAAVLGHERAHLRRRDPLCYLILEALAAAAFMFPVATALRERAEARMELAADRAALAIVPRAALAGALLAGMASTPTPSGIAGLTATEARIAHLAGRSGVSPIPARTTMASLGVAASIVLATVDLAALAAVVRMLCPFCPWIR